MRVLRSSRQSNPKSPTPKAPSNPNHPSPMSSSGSRRRSLRLLSRTDPQTPITDPQTPITDPQMPITDPQMPIADSQMPITDAQTPITDIQTHITDHQTHIADAQTPISIRNPNFHLDIDLNVPAPDQSPTGSSPSSGGCGSGSINKKRGTFEVENGGCTVVGSTGYISLRSGTRIARRRLESIAHVSLEMKENGSTNDEKVGECSKRRYTEKEKGKGKLVECKQVIDINEVVIGDTEGKGKLVVEDKSVDEKQDILVLEDAIRNLEKQLLESDEDSLLNGNEPLRLQMRSPPNFFPMSRRDADKSRAVLAAPKFAFFRNKEEDIEENEEHDDEDLMVGTGDNGVEDWPGPFSTALKIIEEREQKLVARELNSSKSESSGVKIDWKPSDNRKNRIFRRSAPSLTDLCLEVLSENVDEIESLDGVPDSMKHSLVSKLCRSRRMSPRILGLLLRGSPSEIHLSDCSWATEKQFEDALAQCNIDKLKILQLDLAGRCLPDYVIRSTLAKSPNCLPSLTTISLQGAYRLSDDGLIALASSAPCLNSVNLCQCSLVTSRGIISLSNHLYSVLRELYLDDCKEVDAKSILPALKKLKNLEVLTMAHNASVCNKFIRELIPICGEKIRELGFAGCRKLGGASLKVIGENCPNLHSIDLQDLHKMNDLAIGYLANGCRSIQKLKLGCTFFSDEAIAAFLEASGTSLADLSLNNMGKVAEHTATAISRCWLTLRSLDLSFCRKMSDEALGLIVDRCSNLQVLKLFGCTQVTDAFVEGHSNPNVKIIGLKGPILEKIDTSDFLY